MNPLHTTNDPSENDVPFCRRMSVIDPTAYLLGIERTRSDMRQLGGLLCILGIGAAHSALALTAVLVDGMGGEMQIDGLKLPALIATLIQVGLGMAAMAVGFFTLVVTPISKTAHKVAKILLLVVNLGPIPFVITVVRIAQGASEPPEDNAFIPPELNPTQTHIRFVVAMGLLGLVSVCASLIGGLTVVGLNLSAYLGGQAVDKHQGYYVLRFAYYSILQFIGGFSQLALGVFLAAKYGWGPYDYPVHVTVYTVFFPFLTIIVGAVQVLWGIYGWCRAVGWVKIRSKDDNRFMIATLVCWVVTMVLQIIVQPAYGSGMAYLTESQTYAAVYLGNFVMPAWLDYMVRVTPSRIDPSYFSLPEDTKCKEDLLCRIFKMTEDKAADEMPRCSRVSIDCTDRSISVDLEQKTDSPKGFGNVCVIHFRAFVSRVKQMWITDTIRRSG